MVCPVCNIEMDKKIMADVEIDMCNKCKGVWLDKGELTRLTGLDPNAINPLWLVEEVLREGK